MAGVVDEGSQTVDALARRHQRKTEQNRKKQHLQYVAPGEGADDRVRDQIQQKIQQVVMLGGFAGVLRDGGGVRPAGEALAGANDLSNDQPRRQRESRDDFEIHQRLHADAANLLGVVDMGDARRHRAEDDRRDGHFDQLDEAIAQRPHPILVGVFGREPAKQHAKRDGRDHLRIKLAMEGCSFHAASPR